MEEIPAPRLKFAGTSFAGMTKCGDDKKGRDHNDTAGCFDGGEGCGDIAGS